MSILSSRRIINTVTTGRSGTHYLARILSYLPETDVFHESMEHPYHECLREAQSDPLVAKRFLEERTLPFIESCKAPVFIETSHLFCKGFFEPFLELGGRPDLIILRRQRSKIAKSLFELGTIPGKPGKAMDFYLSPNDPNVWRPEGWESFNDYERCYWYCLEIERRARVYKRRALEYGGRVSEVHLDELTTFIGFKNLLRDLDLPSLGFIGSLKFMKNRKRKAGNFDKLKQTTVYGAQQLSIEATLDQAFEAFFNQTKGSIT